MLHSLAIGEGGHQDFATVYVLRVSHDETVGVPLEGIKKLFNGFIFHVCSGGSTCIHFSTSPSWCTAGLCTFLYGPSLQPCRVGRADTTTVLGRLGAVRTERRPHTLDGVSHPCSCRCTAAQLRNARGSSHGRWGRRTDFGAAAACTKAEAVGPRRTGTGHRDEGGQCTGA
eukprot:scaffold2707_cov417-Prasinococcus_capsulatus_cf.AAC.1